MLNERIWKVKKKSLFSCTTVGICAFILISLAAAISHADDMRAAVAANFIAPFKEISAAFEKETRIKVEATYSSTGNLYSQILNGAPYDVFLSADEKTPALLLEKGLCDKPFVYATGRVVLWGQGKKLCGARDWKEALRIKGVNKIAIANPVTAPYGAAAEAALKKSGMWNELGGRLVTAQNVGQSFQYAVSGGTDGSFCALSAALSKAGAGGCYYVLSEAPPITQAACLVKRKGGGNEGRNFLNFLNFLNSPKAAEIKKRYGYQ
jgi:molybdate transport system substrate-binding protein